jgi:dCMP deaminase
MTNLFSNGTYQTADNTFTLTLNTFEPDKWDYYYMRIAQLTAELSSCTRKKVGAILVKNHRIISTGYNGTLPGEDNCCEDSSGLTKPGVLHAEQNVLMKVAASHDSSVGATLYITAAPCIECSKLIIQAGIGTVIYNEIYGPHNNLELLNSHDVKCYKLEYN